MMKVRGRLLKVGSDDHEKEGFKLNSINFESGIYLYLNLAQNEDNYKLDSKTVFQKSNFFEYINSRIYISEGEITKYISESNTSIDSSLIIYGPNKASEIKSYNDVRDTIRNFYLKKDHTIILNLINRIKHLSDENEVLLFILSILYFLINDFGNSLKYVSEFKKITDESIPSDLQQNIELLESLLIHTIVDFEKKKSIYALYSNINFEVFQNSIQLLERKEITFSSSIDQLESYIETKKENFNLLIFGHGTENMDDNIDYIYLDDDNFNRKKYPIKDVFLRFKELGFINLIFVSCYSESLNFPNGEDLVVFHNGKIKAVTIEVLTQSFIDSVVRYTNPILIFNRIRLILFLTTISSEGFETSYKHPNDLN